MSEHHLDARNLLCPMPVIRTQDTIRDLKEGDILEVTSTDPGALNDIPAWCRIHGHRVIESRRQDKEVIIRIQVGPNG